MYEKGTIISAAVCILLIAAGCAAVTRTAANQENKLIVEVSGSSDRPSEGTAVLSKKQNYLLVRDVCLYMIEKLELTADLSLQDKYRIIGVCMGAVLGEDASARIILRGYFEKGDLIVLIRRCSDTGACIAWISNALLSPFDQRPLRGEGAFLERSAPLANLCGVIHLGNRGAELADPSIAQAVPAELAAVHEMILYGRYPEAEQTLHGICTRLPRKESGNSRYYRLTYEILALTSAIDKQKPENLIEYRRFIGN